MFTQFTVFFFFTDVRESINSEEVRKKIEEDKQRASRNPMVQMSDSQREKQRQLDSENSSFITNQHQQVREQMNQQDRNLDLLGGAIDNVHVKAKLINEEIKEQNVMIDKLGEDVDNSNEKMNVVVAALAKLLKTKDSCQVWTIIILGVVLILLVCLVIWT
jgi:cobalamin biosynthesis Mg chelatase CobN